MAYSYTFGAGTLNAYPTGLEGTLTYNGLVLNDNESGPDRYKINKITGLFDAEVRDLRDVNPARHGETSYQSFYGGKTIVISGTIQAGNLSRFRNMISDLQSAFSGLSELPLYMKSLDDQITFITCKKKAPLEMEESFNSKNFKREFQITLGASDPFIYSNNENASSAFLTQVSFVGRSYNVEYNRNYSEILESLDSITVTNNGNFNNLPKVIIYGNVVNPVVINYTTNKYLIFNAEISDNTYYVFDINKKVLVDNAGIFRGGALSFDSTDFYLAPGTNIIGFGASSYGLNAELEIIHRDTYI